MITKGQSISRTVDRALRSAVKISGEDHTFDEISTYLKDAGAEIEKFLKDAVYCGTMNRQSFEQLINGLLPLGVAQPTLDALHDFRWNWYNKAKHDPAFSASTGQALDAIRNAQSATDAVVTANLGSTSRQLVRPNRRVFHLAAWDHYIGGDTEVHFMPATNGDTPNVPYEIIYVEMSKWDAIKAELGSLGQLSLGPNSVPARLYNSWQSESDFLNGGAFEGDYRDLVMTLVKYEQVEDLLPFLKRENDGLSMIAATLSASVDAAAEGDMDGTEQDAVEAIHRVAEDRYAAPQRSRVVKDLAPIVAKVIQTVPQLARSSIRGPIWLRAERYTEEAQYAVAGCEKPVFAIKGDSSLIARIP
jgi:hypothetical protein